MAALLIGGAVGSSAPRPSHPDLFCLACGRGVPQFLPGPGSRANARCPLCQALERHRALVAVLAALTARWAHVDHIIEIAPQATVRRFLAQRAAGRYVGIDLYEPERRMDVMASLTQLPMAADSVPFAVCYHVLEHIPDDRTAMAELARVLAPGGIALLQVPLRRNQTTIEDPDAPEEERLRRFGQIDHVRWYGDDFDVRLAAAGLVTRRLSPGDVLPPEVCTSLGLRPREVFWLATPHDTEAVLDEVLIEVRDSLGRLAEPEALTAHADEAARVRAQQAAAEQRALRWPRRIWRRLPPDVRRRIKVRLGR